MTRSTPGSSSPPDVPGRSAHGASGRSADDVPGRSAHGASGRSVDGASEQPVDGASRSTDDAVDRSAATQDVRYGVDIGGTSTEVVRLGADGTVEARAVTPTPHGEALIEGTIEAIQAVSLGASIGTVGIGVPGQVDPRAGTVRHAVNLGLDGRGLALGGAVARTLGVPVHVENDGRAAALGAQRLLAPDASVAVLVTIGTGVSAGVVIDGRVHRGRDGLAGEIGHVVVDPSGPPCACGLNGCLEVLVSGAALRRRWPDGGEGSAAADLYAAAAAGNPDAQRVAADVTGHLVAALHWLVTAYGADVVVLAGGVGRIGGPLLGAIRERIDQLGQGSPFAAGLLEADRVLAVPADLPVGAIGAAVLADAGHPAVQGGRGDDDRTARDRGEPDRGERDQGGRDQGGRDQGGRDQGGRDQGEPGRGGRDRGDDVRGERTTAEHDRGAGGRGDAGRTEEQAAAAPEGAAATERTG